MTQHKRIHTDSAVNKKTAAALLLMLLTSLASLTGAAPIQRINEIQAPLLNVPAIVRAGETFRLELKTGEKTVESAMLIGATDPSMRAELKLHNPSDYKDIRTYRAEVPSNAAEALYDLKVVFDDDRSDTQPHAVKVVAEFKKEFVFVHLTDIHYNLGRSDPGDVRIRVRDMILDEITALGPEFVIFSGDLGLYPETYDYDYDFGYERFVDRLSVPIFMVPGNHEMYIDTRVAAPIDGMDYWKAMYGPTFMSFNYGNLHVVGINDFDWSERWRDRFNPDIKATGSAGVAFIGEEQWEWIKEDIGRAAAAGDRIIAFTHIPVELLQGGHKFGVVDPEKLDGPSASTFIRFLEHYAVSHIFVGHLHFDSIRNLADGVTEVLTIGAGHNSKLDEKKWGYRIVRVSGGTITEMETREIAESDVR